MRRYVVEPSETFGLARLACHPERAKRVEGSAPAAGLLRCRSFDFAQDDNPQSVLPFGSAAVPPPVTLAGPGGNEDPCHSPKRRNVNGLVASAASPLCIR